MNSTPDIPIGIGAPNVLPVPVTSPPVSAGGVDLTTVSAVHFRVFDPNGVEVTPSPAWAGMIQAGATATSAVLLYAFVGNEFAMAGTWRIAPVLTVTGGSVPCKHVNLNVTAIP